MGIIIDLEKYRVKKEADLQIEYPAELNLQLNIEKELEKIKLNSNKKKIPQKG